jgi:hypothetical protein
MLLPGPQLPVALSPFSTVEGAGFVTYFRVVRSKVVTVSECKNDLVVLIGCF